MTYEEFIASLIIEADDFTYALAEAKRNFPDVDWESYVFPVCTYEGCDRRGNSRWDTFCDEHRPPRKPCGLDSPKLEVLVRDMYESVVAHGINEKSPLLDYF